MPSPGALLCLSSAAAFGAMGIFGKLGDVSAVGYGWPAGGALVLLGCVQCLVR